MRLFCADRITLMKQTHTLLPLLVLCASTSSAQVTNGGFENWTGQVPDGWSNNNIAPLNLYPVSQSTDAHSGAFAARGEVLFASGSPVPPALQNLSQAVTSQPSAFTGWYKFSPASSGDQMTVSITLLDAGSAPVAVAFTLITAAQSSYAQFDVAIDYNLGNPNPPATATISFGIAGAAGLPTQGSWFVVDDLALTAGTGIEEQGFAALRIGAPYPVPATSILNLPLEAANSTGIVLSVLDAAGRELVLVPTGSIGTGAQTLAIPISELGAGSYVLRVATPEGQQHRAFLISH